MKILRARCDVLTNTWRPASKGLPLGATPLVRGDLYALQFLAEEGPGVAYDLSDYSTNAIFGLKTADEYDAGGDFAVSFAGFDTGDVWHDLNIGQGTILFAVPASLLTLGRYAAAVVLFDADGNRFHLGAVPLWVNIIEPLYLSTESNAPAGVPGSLTGTATISGSNTSVVVTVTGMTTTGKVVVWQETSTAGYVTPMVSYGTGNFTITVPTAPEMTTGDGLTYKFGYQVARKST